MLVCNTMRCLLRVFIVALLALMCVASDDIISSTFAFDSEGWTATHDDAAISYSSHSVRAFCKNRKDVYFLAPPKFLGQQRALFGGRIELRLGFYEYNADGKDMATGYDFIIDSDRTGFSLGLPGIVKPWDFVTDANFSVDAATGWEHISNGAAVSTPEMMRTLSSISRVRVRACFYAGHQDVYISKLSFLKTSTAKAEKTSVKSSRQPGRDRLDEGDSQSSSQQQNQAREQEVLNARAPDSPVQAAAAAQAASPLDDSTLTEEQKRSLLDQKFQQRQFEEQQELLRQQQRKALRDTPADETALAKLREAAGTFLTTYISGRGHALGLTSTSLYYSNGKSFESLSLSDITSVTVGDDGNVHIRSGDVTLLAAGPMNVYSVRDLGTFFEKVRLFLMMHAAQLICAVRFALSPSPTSGRSFDRCSCQRLDKLFCGAGAGPCFAAAPGTPLPRL
jgi:hypothetical protein